MMIDYFEFTDQGDREINEDSIVALEKQGNYCFVVCDGLGGHGQGEIASSIACAVFSIFFFVSSSIFGKGNVL